MPIIPPSPRRSQLVAPLATALLLLAACEAPAEILLQDDFGGSALDTSKWFVPTGAGTFFGRTQIRPPSETLTVSGGVIRLQLDTHNPTAQVPGDSFWGSEIQTLETFPVSHGLVFEARTRLVSPMPGGLVGALFSFVFLPPNARDEIDVELLSNDLQISSERVLTNVFDDDDFSQPGDKAFADVEGLALDEFHLYTVHWLPHRVEWRVDGALVRVETGTVPNDPMNVRLDLWAPDAFFTEAYDGALQPVASAEDNEVYFYEVDRVVVRRPVSAPTLGRRAMAALVVLLVAVTVGRLRGQTPQHRAA